jgi:hypothetical protein
VLLAESGDRDGNWHCGKIWTITVA